jgi:glycosyltransferase involved in cell wall biosynthesis
VKRLKMLFVTPYLPSPPRFGGQRRLAGLIGGLSRSHEVSVLSFVDPREDFAASIRATAAYCKRVIAVPNERLALTTPRKRLLQGRSLLSKRSFADFVYHTARLEDALQRLLAQEPYDVVQFEFTHMAANRPRNGVDSGRRPIFVLDEHNIEYDILRRTAGADTALDRKLYNSIDWRKLREEEQEAWRHLDGCALTSTRDEALLRHEVPTAKTAVVPNAVDIDFFRPRAETGGEDPKTIVFFGALNYHPNIDAMLFFLREILPRLKARHPELKFQIVGQHPPPAIVARAGDGVELTGLVDDVRPYLARAAVVVAPIRIGGGTRFKILEAMAMGKAIVSTAIGAEGIEVRHGSDILLADEPDSFSEQVDRLLSDAGLRRAIGAAARSLIERRYGWPASVHRLEAFHAELLAAARTST